VVEYRARQGGLSNECDQVVQEQHVQGQGHRYSRSRPVFFEVRVTFFCPRAVLKVEDGPQVTHVYGEM